MDDAGIEDVLAALEELLASEGAFGRNRIKQAMLGDEAKQRYARKPHVLARDKEGLARLAIPVRAAHAAVVERNLIQEDQVAEVPVQRLQFRKEANDVV